MRDNYDLITESDDWRNIDDVSMLRHFINVWGYIPKKLAKRYKTTVETLETIASVSPGMNTIKYAVSNLDKIIEENRRKELAHIKNQILISDLKRLRNTFCGIGTRKTKLFLNRLSKNGDNIARLYRTAIEIEDKNIQAKNTSPYYRDKVYKTKYELITHLITLCDQQNVTYGIQDSDVRDTNSIIYFELPECQQISFHCSFNDKESLPKYKGEWDHLENSTLEKLENAINTRYREQLDNIINKM